MSRRFKVWLDSGANVHSCHKQEIDLFELGITGDEWDSMTEIERDEFMREIAFEQSDWGYAEIDGDAEE